MSRIGARIAALFGHKTPEGKKQLIVVVARDRDGLLEITGRLFGLRYRRVRGVRVWHESVEVYDVFEDGLFIPPDEIATALDTYYELAGWDKTTGNPKQEKLAELGLEWIA